jgi:hypothetical protein
MADELFLRYVGSIRRTPPQTVMKVLAPKQTVQQ